MQTAFHGKIKERRETRGEWYIGVNTQNIPYLSIIATKHKTQDKTKVLKVRIDEGQGA